MNVSHPPAAWLACIGLAEAALVGADARAAGRVLLLASPSTGAQINGESLALALSIQLAPYSLDVERVEWTPPRALAAQQQAARELCARRGASRVIWHAPAEPDAIVVHLLDAHSGPLRSIPIGQPAPGIERTMAIAIRTALQATAGDEAPPTAATEVVRATAPPREPIPFLAPKRALREDGILSASAGYGVAFFPTGAGVRHGPELALALRVWRRLHAELGLGYQLPEQGRDAGGNRWKRSVVSVALGAHHGWPLSARRWELRAGARVRLGLAGAEARSAAGNVEQDLLVELSIGATAELRLQVHSRVACALGGLVGWLPLGHRVLVGGVEVARSGHLELGLLPSVAVSLW